jgi:hypothetical protein
MDIQNIHRVYNQDTRTIMYTYFLYWKRLQIIKGMAQLYGMNGRILFPRNILHILWNRKRKTNEKMDITVKVKQTNKFDHFFSSMTNDSTDYKIQIS